MSGQLLLANALGRLTDATGNAATADRIPGFDASTGKIVGFSADQISSGANAVDGPASSTDNAIARFDSTTGKLLQDSGVLVDDSDNMTIPGDLIVSGGDVDAGASGTAGSYDVFPSTTSKGKTSYTTADNTGDTTTTITTALQAGARTYTTPDAGASASYAMTEGAQTINGIQTFGAINNLKATDAITAFSGGGQASAVQLTSQVNRITVCAADGDSVKLPTAVPGQDIEVSNIGATYADVFPISGDLIDSLAANVAISLPPGESIRYTCSVALKWKSTSLPQPGASFVTGAHTTPFVADELTGGAFTVYNNTQGTPGTITTRTATQMFIDDAYSRVAGTYHLRIINNQGTGTLTVGNGTGVTLTGTMTIAVNTFRDFVVTYTSATALVIQSTGIGTDD